MQFQEIEQKTKKYKNKIYRALVSKVKVFKEDWISDLKYEWIEEESNMPFNEFYQYYIQEYMEFYLHHYLLRLICIKLDIKFSDIDVLSVKEKNKLTEPFILKFRENYDYVD